MSFRAKGTRPLRDLPTAIPFFSVWTEKDAKDLFVRLAKLSYDNKRYTIAGWSGWHGETDDIEHLTELFASNYPRRTDG